MFSRESLSCILGAGSFRKQFILYNTVSSHLFSSLIAFCIMCGRSCLSLSKEDVQCACIYKSKNSKKFKKPDWLDEHNGGKEYVPSYNIAPTEITPVLVSASKYVEQAAPTDRALKPMMWGLIPPWHKGDYKSHKLSTSNCRLENIKTSKLYNPILRKGGRCVVVVEGFYEWQTTKNSKMKQPYYIYPPQDSDVQETCNFNEEEGHQRTNLLHIAGLYNQWKNDDIIIYSYSVITMESTSLLSWLHHRMPAILETQEQVEGWLNTEELNPDMAISLLHPVKMLSVHQVSLAVNNSKYKSKDCIQKIDKNNYYNNSQKTLSGWLKYGEKKRKMDSGDTTIPKKFKK